MVNEEMLLNFIRSMRTFEDQHTRGDYPRYKVRGQGQHYTVWDTYLLQDVDIEHHTTNIAYYVHSAQQLNDAEDDIQTEYDRGNNARTH